MHHFCKKTLLNIFIVMRKKLHIWGGKPVYKEFMLEEMLNFETVISSTVQFWNELNQGQKKCFLNMHCIVVGEGGIKKKKRRC